MQAAPELCQYHPPSADIDGRGVSAGGERDGVRGGNTDTGVDASWRYSDAYLCFRPRFTEFNLNFYRFAIIVRIV